MHLEHLDAASLGGSPFAGFQGGRGAIHVGGLPPLLGNSWSDRRSGERLGKKGLTFATHPLLVFSLA